MQNKYEHLTNLYKETYNGEEYDLINNCFREADDQERNKLLSETNNYNKNAFFTYLTPINGFVPILHIYKNDLEQFIHNMEQNNDCEIYFLSDPLFDNPKICCSKWICKNNKFYFTEYEDGHCPFCSYYLDLNKYVEMKRKIIDKLKIIYNKIPDDLDIKMKLY